ncbi:YceI family protein [Pontivivens ytuae]|uniref:YceI family protein n=1 Tax=Pontivivens ytuae TaxID=2789856 RepID=A0A7S9LP01_9RHOB|nr:YceI family protein [Pontivivens ytuae]QPH52330.1 YceI family protein [Pontivivens ytuae]
MLKALITAAALTTAPLALSAADWTLDSEASTVGFVTVKEGEIAEAHSFDDLTGTVAEGGEATVSIPLASVETLIDIRNERMREILFDVANFPEATVSAEIDLAAYESLGEGERTQDDITITVATNDHEATYDATVNVTRIGADRVAVSTARPVLTDARDFGYGDGVAQLREIAGLEAISPAVPVNFDLVFDR